MQVNGSGGSFVEQVYRLPANVAWQLGLQTARDMQVEVEQQDDANMLLTGTILTGEKSFLFGKPKKKVFVFNVQPLAEGCQVIVDIHKEQLEVYSLRAQNKETTKFVELFEEKAQAYTESRICPNCGAAVPKQSAFCPHCGTKL